MTQVRISEGADQPKPAVGPRSWHEAGGDERYQMPENVSRKWPDLTPIGGMK
jgi:hypothetical protein